MKKILVVTFVLVTHLFLANSIFAVGGGDLDVRLKLLLNDETNPFYPDSIRIDFINMSLKKCGQLSYMAADFAVKCSVMTAFPDWILPATLLDGTGFSSNTPITKIQYVLLANDDYGLMQIHPKDIAQKKIATTEPARYWYEQSRTGANGFFLRVYPKVDTKTIVWVFGSVAPLWADTAFLNPAFENEVVLYALYLCKQRQGEHEVANFIRQIAINEIMDLKAILENRPVDVTVAKEVVPR